MKRALLLTAVAVPLLLALSYPWRNSTSGPGHVLSTIGWLGFLLDLLTVLVLSTILTVRKLRASHRRSTT